MKSAVGLRTPLVTGART